VLVVHFALDERMHALKPLRGEADGLWFDYGKVERVFGRLRRVRLLGL
jgi:hypothetical protein